MRKRTFKYVLISFISEKISSSNEINKQKISEIKQLIEAELEPFERKSTKENS